MNGIQEVMGSNPTISIPVSEGTSQNTAQKCGILVYGSRILFVILIRYSLFYIFSINDTMYKVK